MNRCISGWKLTHDPTGTPVVLMNYGDLIETELQPSMNKPVEVVDIAGSDWPFLRKMGNRKFELKFGVWVTYDSTALARRAVLDSLLVVGAWDRKAIRVEVLGISGTYWTFAKCWVTEHAPTPSIERGKNRALKNYTITATEFSRTGT